MPGGFPMLGVGDMVHGAAGGEPTRLPADTSDQRVFLRQQSTDGGYPAAPAWDTILSTDVLPVVVALQPAGGIVVVPADQGSVFTVTLTASAWTIHTPSWPAGALPPDATQIRLRLAQDLIGMRTVEWGAGYDFGAAGIPVLSTAAGKVDVLDFEYNAALAAWCCLRAALGF